MIKLVALWDKPLDVESFDQDYLANHVPLVDKLPLVTGVTTSVGISGEVHRMAEIGFQSMEDLSAALASPEGKHLVADSQRLVEKFAVGLQTFIAKED